MSGERAAPVGRRGRRGREEALSTRARAAARLAVVLGVTATFFLNSGCILLPTLGGPPPALEPPAVPAPGAPPGVDAPPTSTAAPTPRGAAPGVGAKGGGAGSHLLDLRGAVHCHSEYSHDSRGRIEEIAAAARRAGVRFVAMTDHFTPQGINCGARGFVDGVLFMAGAEWSREKGSILGIAVGDARPPAPGGFPVREMAGNANALIAQVREAGGLAYVGHCEKFRGFATVEGYDGIEVANLHAAAVSQPWWFYPAALVLPPGAFFARVAGPDRAVLERWDRLLETRQVPAIGGCDAHANVRLFGPLGGVVGDYEECFRAVTTHVVARELSIASVTRALIEGRAYVAFEIDGDATGFGFDLVEAGAAPGAPALATQGGEARFREGLALLVRVPGGSRTEAVIFRDGAPWVEGPGAGFAVRLDAPGVYRAEAALDGRPFVISNAIRVRP